MTLEHGHEPTEWGSAPRPTIHPTSSGSGQPVHYNSARHGSHVEESPELLRWRADLLMDEMMMGGVDLSAADGNRTFSGIDAPIVQRSQPTSAPPSSSQSPSTQAPTNGNSYSNGGNGQSPRGNYDRSSYDSRYENGRPINGENGSNGYGDSSYSSTEHNGNEYNGNGHSSNAQSSNGQSNGYAQQRPAEPPHTNGTNGGGYPSPASNYQVNNDAPPVTPRENYQTGEPRDFGTREYDSRDYGTRNGDTNRPEAYSGEQNRNGSYHDDGRTRGYYDNDQDAGAQNRSVTNEPPTNSPTAPRTTTDSTPDPRNVEQNAQAARLYSVEQQYEQFHRDQNPSVQPVEPPASNPPASTNAPATYSPSITPQPTNQVDNPPQTAIRPPLPPIEPTRQSMPSKPPRVTPPPVDEHTQWAAGPDKWEYQDFAADPEAEEENDPFGAYTAPERRLPPESAVRQDPAQFVSAMSVVGSSKKRSTLLPRSSELDIDNLHREISDLHGEIAILLPVGNETSERARHLLDKAYSILQSDPSRSAEVEYYMQQVRTIVQRLHQARKWSDLYRQRLNLYLWGWLGLSAVMLIATFLFQSELEEALMWLVGVGPDSALVENWTTFLGTAFAGALGGAIGALYTMQKHASGEHSFFDRKYGLRGLILPFMGLIVGAVGYLIFGVIFALLGADPSENLTLAIIPIVAAFAFGFSQESIYGTRG